MDQLMNNPAGEAMLNRSKPTSRLLPAGIGAIALLIVLAALGTVGNAQLSSTYSAQQAVRLYLAAQARGDAAGMQANATFVHGDGSYSQFFDRSALNAMLQLHQNTDLRGVTIVSDRAVSGTKHAVTVEAVWAGSSSRQTLMAVPDPSRSQFGIYHPWRVQVPASTIRLSLPKQAGAVKIDGIPLPAGSTSALQVIPGFHLVSMDGTDLLDGTNSTVDARAAAVDVPLNGALSQKAVALAKTAVTDTFQGDCDTAKYHDCLGHTYRAPDQNYIYYFDLPGYGQVEYTSYVVSLTSDPTSAMQLALQSDAGKVAASGTCAYTVTVDGSRRYYLKGTWSGTLTWNVDGFDTDLNFNCEDAKA